jgi:hypothetical protein
VRLTDKEIKEIEDAGDEFQMGFPYSLLGGVTREDAVLLRAAGHHDFEQLPKVLLMIRS